MSYTDSDPVTANATFQGVWIHDPDNPQETVNQFLYGGSNKSESVDIMGVSNWFDGRAFPVVDFGEHQEDVFEVAVQIPHGPTWSVQVATLRGYAEAKKTLCVRDNRGRRYFGTMSGYKNNDQPYGTDAGFQVTRVNFDEGDEVSP